MYTPQPAPTDPAELSAFLTRELQAIAREWQQQTPFLFLQTLYAAPDRPREGMLVKADGTTWNPGSGAGVYAYVSGAWVKL
jgi:hypothetical protein